MYRPYLLSGLELSSPFSCHFIFYHVVTGMLRWVISNHVISIYLLLVGVKDAHSHHYWVVTTTTATGSKASAKTPTGLTPVFTNSLSASRA